jgi:preprotein translocase subunit SecG
MANVLIVAYLLIVVALIAVILLQRSEGGGLGMGTSGSNGLISVRGSANLLTRTTAILAALFFASAIGLTILAELDRGTSGILEGASQGGATPTTVLDALQQMQQQTGGDLPLPGGAAPAPATTTAPATDPGLALPAAPATTEPAPAAPATDAAPAAGATTAPATPAPATTEQPAAP